MNFKTFFTTVLDILFPHKAGSRKTDLSLHFSPSEPISCVYSLFTYKEPVVRKAIWQLKYHKDARVAGSFAHVLHSFLLEELVDLILFSGFRDPLLIPMPVSATRRKERGYNQCEVLLDHLCTLNKGELEVNNHILIKTKDTPRQTTLDRRHRLENIRDCFSLTQTEIIKDRNIILIDDVVTTGSTVEEARATLLSGGARKVVVITLAH